MDSCLVRIDVTERTVAAAADTPLVAGNLGADTFSLTLDAAWEGLDRLLLTFSNAATVRTVDVTENRTGVIPWEVLTQGELRFSLQGYRYEDGDMILRLATRQMERGLPVCSAGCDPGEDPRESTPAMWELALARLDSAAAAEILSLRTPVEKSHTITDSAELPPEDIHIYGESSQSGTPAPDAPVEIVSTEEPVITVENGAGEMQTVSLSGITLRGLRDADGNWAARDEIAVSKGSVTLIRRTKEYVFTGEEAISFNLQLSDGRCQYYTYSVNGGTGDRSAGISTHCAFSHGAAYLGQQIGIFVSEKITWLVWNKSKSEIKADLQAKYAAGAPLTVVYPLATPIITDITDTEAGQALLALHTCYPTTRVLCDADCSLTYKADITNAFAKLTHELDTMKQAIISSGGII